MESVDDERRSEAAGRSVLKTLTLLRHAKSSWDDDALPDHDRPLAARGLDDAPRMGLRLAARGLEPDLILSSTAARARQTAELVLAGLGGTAELRSDPRIYLASPGELLAVIAGVGDDIRELMLVGHNPGMTELVRMIVPGLGLANLPTAGAVAVDCETSRWSSVDAAAFALRFYDFPKNPEPITAHSTSQKQ